MRRGRPATARGSARSRAMPEMPRLVVEVRREVPRLLVRRADEQQPAGRRRRATQRARERPGALDPRRSPTSSSRSTATRAASMGPSCRTRSAAWEDPAHERTPCAVDPRRDAARRRPASLVGVLGGTGEQGRGLAVRLAARRPAGRASARATPARAAEIAAEVGHGVRGRRQRRAARATADVVIVAVPWDGHARAARSLAGRARRQGRRRLRQPARLRQAGRLRARRSTEGSRRSRPRRCCPTARVVGGVPPRSRRAAARPRGRVDRHRHPRARRRPRGHRPRAGARRPDRRACAASTPAGCATRTRSRR